MRPDQDLPRRLHMMPRLLKMELWFSVVLATLSVGFLGFVVLMIVRDRFPEALVPWVNRFLGTQENAAIAADIGIKLALASALGLLLSFVGFVHYFLMRRNVGRQLDLVNDPG